MPMALKRLDFKSLPNDKHLGAAGQVCTIVANVEVPGFPLFGERKTGMNDCTQVEDGAYKRSCRWNRHASGRASGCSTSSWTV